MRKTKSRMLVIDASVARAVGSNSPSKPLRDFLVAVYEICHCAVATQKLIGEWKKHQSIFFQQWRSSMYAKRKIKMEEIPENRYIRQMIESIRNDRKKQQAMQKDLHLIESALHADKIIISLDENAKNNYSDILEKENIAWINPLTDQDPITLLGQ